MLHACDQRFDVTGNLENFCELNKSLINKADRRWTIQGSTRMHACSCPDADGTHIDQTCWCQKKGPGLRCDGFCNSPPRSAELHGAGS